MIFSWAVLTIPAHYLVILSVYVIVPGGCLMALEVYFRADPDERREMRKRALRRLFLPRIAEYDSMDSIPDDPTLRIPIMAWVSVFVIVGLTLPLSIQEYIQREIHYIWWFVPFVPLLLYAWAVRAWRKWQRLEPPN